VAPAPGDTTCIVNAYVYPVVNQAIEVPLFMVVASVPCALIAGVDIDGRECHSRSRRLLFRWLRLGARPGVGTTLVLPLVLHPSPSNRQSFAAPWWGGRRLPHLRYCTCPERPRTPRRHRLGFASKRQRPRSWIAVAASPSSDAVAHGSTPAGPS
jgi:hypothetical protein